MNFAFDGQQGLILVGVEVLGPSGLGLYRLALDTGATSSLINAALLSAIGYDPAAATTRVPITTGSGHDTAPRIEVERVVSLGVAKDRFPILAYTLPQTVGVDGVLGLDFLRGHVLSIDFRSGLLRIA